MSSPKVLIIGGGPAGSIAALALNKLGHEVDLYERADFPRYRIGESLLPGTMSILYRLGLHDKITAAGFVKKPSATFLWGQNQAPWTFSFSTPKVADWVFDHAIQVKREEFDALLLDQAKARGVNVHSGTSVRSVDVSSPDEVRLSLDGPDASGVVTGDYLIDASGSSSVLVRDLGLRRFDDFYRSLAVWSYFRRPDPFTGDLAGTTYSITFEDGWVWMIPLKGDLYSVGVVVDHSKSEEIQQKGRDQFFKETLRKCSRAMKILDDAEMVDEVRIVRDWSYDTTTFSAGRFFLCGDAACFTDPLFSQGVHLAAQSAVSAASAIDRLVNHPEEAETIHRWYGQTYGETYEQYHEFLASFYTFASFTEPASEFWQRRRIEESDDSRLERRAWFNKLVSTASLNDDFRVSDFRDRAATMISIGKHQRLELSSEFSDAELNPARICWLSNLSEKLNTIVKIRWTGSEVKLYPYYKVHPTKFKLEPKFILGSEDGRVLSKYGIEPEYADVFRSLSQKDVDYKSLVLKLSTLGAKTASSQIIMRLFEAGLLVGLDKHGEPVPLPKRLRFDGIGVEYEV
jgi:flavin-dependent dehydrogenase